MRLLAFSIALRSIALALPLTASAATISIVSMQYSAAHPVPHLHYEGDTADGDVATLQGMYYPAILEPRTDTSVSPIEG